MSRKRYVSTEISVDSRVRKLAERSEFAALLYTWMIPHALDDTTITADPDELLMQVVPGFRWRSAEDVAEAIKAMVELGLVRCDGERLRFPEKAFYQYQSYVGAERRATEPEPTPPPQNGAHQRKSAQIAADKNFAPEPPQNRASSSVSSSSSFSHSLSDTPSLRSGAAAPRRNGNPRVAAVIDALRGHGLDVHLGGRDTSAIKNSTAPPELIADTYAAVARHEWGDPHMRNRLSIHAAVDWVNAYELERSAAAKVDNPFGDVPTDEVTERLRVVRDSDEGWGACADCGKRCATEWLESNNDRCSKCADQLRRKGAA